ncbi:site-specific integrase [Klebsiella aerogenes]|uniref:site-specific integrase n=1 Tax=Klebsiella aerogenes TaxID=548 RepID=UPI001F27A37F|nr:site-specific integrase [Klebsiella aerogenes]
MARLIHSCRIALPEESQHTTGITRGKGIDEGLPALYDNKGHFVAIVNQWFLALKTVRRLDDISSSARALLRYWTFLERENLRWDQFPPVDRLKPTYYFRNTDLLNAARDGKLALSTANMYIRHVIQFYLWAIENYHLTIRSEKEAPFKLRFIDYPRNDHLAHLRPRIAVQTSDLRIRIPDRAPFAPPSLTPLTREHLVLLASQLCHQSVEFSLMTRLACESGLRLKEVCTFTVEALSRGRPASSSRNRYYLSIGPDNGVRTKFRKKRTIEVSSPLMHALQHYAISERRLRRLSKLTALTEKWQKNPALLSEIQRLSCEQATGFDPLFISQQGNCIQPSVLNARWVAFRNEIARTMPGFCYRFHDLRSTYATYRLHDLLNGGLSEGDALDCLMGWMGHKDEKTTLKYIRYLRTQEILKTTLSSLDSLMDLAVRAAAE